MITLNDLWRTQRGPCLSTLDGDSCIFWSGHHGFHAGEYGAWGYSEGDERAPADPIGAMFVDVVSEEGS
ncbi:MAG TPA: hypothetical protein VGU71_22445 [Candidatus Dormibacteraeota bacterium]|nr:hypothetical protein [Candidatus Dormibacteraeota bacterium]